MAKMRGFKPEIWTDDKFVQLSPLARLLFMGMWNYACDNGHLEDKPVQIKMRILPADNCDVAELIEEIVEQGMVTRKKGILTVPKLGQHQRLDKRYFTTCEHCSPAERTTSARSERDGDTSGARSAPTLKEGRKEVRGEEGERSTRERASSESDFATFYDLYPKKVAKGQAAKAHKAALKKASAATILDGLKAHLPIWEKTERQFIPNPATWLNGERWADEVDKSAGHAPPAHIPSVDQLVAERGF